MCDRHLFAPFSLSHADRPLSLNTVQFRPRIKLKSFYLQNKWGFTVNRIYIVSFFASYISNFLAYCRFSMAHDPSAITWRHYVTVITLCWSYQRKLKLTFIFPLFVSDNSLIIDLSPFKPERLERSDVLPEWWPPDVVPESLSFVVIGHFWLFWAQAHSLCLHKHFLCSEGPSFQRFLKTQPRDFGGNRF